MSRKSSVIRKTAALSLIASLFGAAVAAVVFWTPTALERTAIEEAQRRAVRMQADIVDTELFDAFSDALLLGRLSCVPDLFSDDAAVRSIAARRLEADFLAFSEARRIYDQIRILDDTGLELIRVNLTSSGPILVPREELQNKSDRYYYAETMALDATSLYVSPFDLNIERGAVELPFKPMIRVGLPIFDRAGRKRGMVVVNYLGARLLDRMKSHAEFGDLKFFLLDADGYWLMGPDPEDEWGFMFDDRRGRTIRRSFPAAADAILGGDEGSVETKDGLFTFLTFRPDDVESRLFRRESSPRGMNAAISWKCVSFMGRTDLLKSVWRREAIVLAFLVAYVLVAAVLIWHRVSTNEARLAAEGKLLAAKHAAETANASKTIFLANMSHEIRTPMNAILGFTDILKAEETDERKAKYLQAIASSGEALLAIINDLLDLSKVEAGKMDLAREPTDLASLIEELRYIYVPAAEKKGLYIDVASDPLLPRNLLLDRVRLRQILVNLVGNAIKFTDDGGLRISASCAPRADEPSLVDLRIDVSDSGMGIAYEDQERIFGAFEQATVVWGKRLGGTGLGLAISRRLTELMGGRLTVTSAPERGSVFTVHLPAVEAADSAKTEHPKEDGRSGIAFAGGRILLVDDVPENNMLIRGYLLQHPFEFREAANGAEALAAIDEFRPDVVITDLKMPIMGGLEFLEKLRADAATESIPVILLTASITREDESALRAYADSYLHKPVKRDALLAELVRYLPLRDAGGGTGPEATEASVPSGDGLPGQIARGTFRTYFSAEALPRLRAIGDKLLVDDILDIARDVGRKAQEIGFPDAQDWSVEVERAALSFDVEALRRLLSSAEGLPESRKAGGNDG